MINLVLIGARGSGKSAVATELSRLLNVSVVSTDAEIERRVGTAIKDFVATNGWDAFREVESEIVREVAAADNHIIDTGGGVVLRKDNVAALRANGMVFWLQAPVETLAARIKDDPKRPSLTGKKSHVEEIEEVLRARTPLYSEAAHFVINSDGRTLGEVAREIISQFTE